MRLSTELHVQDADNPNWGPSLDSACGASAGDTTLASVFAGEPQAAATTSTTISTAIGPEGADVTVEGASLTQFLREFGFTTANDRQIGLTIPTVSGTSTLTGQPMTIAPNGSPQVIVFLAHWDPNAQIEARTMAPLAKDGAIDGVAVKAVSSAANSTSDNWPPTAWLSGIKWAFPTLADHEGTGRTAADAFGVGKYPFFVFVDSAGKVVARSDAQLSATDLKNAVAALKAGQTPSLPA